MLQKGAARHGIVIMHKEKQKERGAAERALEGLAKDRLQFCHDLLRDLIRCLVQQDGFFAKGMCVTAMGNLE